MYIDYWLYIVLYNRVFMFHSFADNWCHNNNVMPVTVIWCDDYHSVYVMD